MLQEPQSEENTQETQLESGVQEQQTSINLPEVVDLDTEQDSDDEEEEVEERDTFVVTKVIDGDTLDIDTGERVRLACIDSPEYYEAYYQEAKVFLEDLVLGKEVRLVKDVSETGKYGRLIRYIYLMDGTFVDELIVREGYAKAYPYEPDTKFCPQIIEAENKAKSEGLGLWGVEEEPKPADECSSNIYNCGDFATRTEAQAMFELCGGVENDIHQLDGDGDGRACESLSG
tara:strand:+ start:13328 stop:14020 length:693 start_codon:yes stop_codon:yes gene_type:complete